MIQPPVPLAAQSARPVLIKADDLSISSKLSTWDRFLAVVVGAGASADIGVILKSADEDAIHRLRNWITTQGSRSAEYFNHGSEHTLEEFNSDAGRLDFGERFRALATQELRYVGRRFEGFGAPFNSLCSEAISAYFDVNPDGYIYYPDREPANERAATGRRVSFDYHVSFERKEQGYDPSLEYFRRAHKRRIETWQPLVLQVHPGRWSARGYDEFAAILQYLREHGASFMTASQFIESTSGSMTPAPQQIVADEVAHIAGIARQAAGWDATRFEAPELEKTRVLLDHVLGTKPPDHWRGTSALDLGCGIGDWLYLLPRGAPFRRIYGLEARKDVAALARQILDVDAHGSYEVIHASVGEPFKLDSRVALTICNRALKYFDVFQYLDCIEAHSNLSAIHFIGYQTFSFYWCGLRSALTAGKTDLARRRTQVLVHSLRRLAGLDLDRSQETVLPTSDLIALLGSRGHHLLRRFPVQRHANGAEMVVGLVFEAAPARASTTALMSRELLARLERAGAGVLPATEISPGTLERIGRLGKTRGTVGDLSPDQGVLDIVASGLELFQAGRIEDCLRFLTAHPDLGL